MIEGLTILENKDLITTKTYFISMKLKIRNLVSRPYIIRYGTHRRRLVAKIRKACDDLPRNQRLMVVTILLSAFILAAFFVFGKCLLQDGDGSRPPILRD